MAKVNKKAHRSKAARHDMEAGMIKKGRDSKIPASIPEHMVLIRRCKRIGKLQE